MSAQAISLASLICAGRSQRARAMRGSQSGTRDGHATEFQEGMLELGRRQLAKDVSGFVFPTEQVGIVLFGLTALPGVEPEALAEAFWRQLEDAARIDLPPSEIERARRRHFAGSVSALQSLDDRADLLAQYATYFDAPERAFREATALEEIDSGALRPLVAERLARTRAVTLTVLPAGDSA